MIKLLSLLYHLSIPNLTRKRYDHRLVYTWLDQLEVMFATWRSISRSSIHLFSQHIPNPHKIIYMQRIRILILLIRTDHTENFCTYYNENSRQIPMIFFPVIYEVFLPRERGFFFSSPLDSTKHAKKKKKKCCTLRVIASHRRVLKKIRVVFSFFFLSDLGGCR